jgi:hypothetical protein
MLSGMASPTRQWFQLALPDKDLSEWGPARYWLDTVRDRMMHVFSESNFYLGLATLYPDLVTFGSAAMLMYEDYEDVFRVTNPCLGEFYFANSPRMNVDTFYREFTYTAEQIVREFGMDNATPSVQQMYKEGGAMLTREKLLGHAIEPNDDRFGPKIFNHMPFREIYWEQGTGQQYVLRTRGYHEFPAICSRWDLAGNDAYGRSPGMDALGDIKQLQVEQKRKMQAIDKMVHPPLLADVSLKNQPTSTMPDFITYVDNLQGTGFKPVYEVNPPLDGIVADLTQCQQRIQAIFYYDIFRNISQLDTVRSATEISARQGEQIVQIGPVVERNQDEVFSPAIDRLFGIMARGGLLPPPPQEIMGKALKVNFVSSMAQMQRSEETVGIERLNQLVGNIAGIHPEILDAIDFDEEARIFGDRLNVPAKVFKPLAEVSKLRIQRAKQQALQQQMQVTTALTQGAQNLSQTKVGNQNMLEALSGSGNGGVPPNS